MSEAPRIAAAERAGAPTCPLCRETLNEGGVACGGCETSYHRACREEFGACGTLGCPEARAPSGRPRRPPPGVAVHRRAWEPAESYREALAWAVGTPCLTLVAAVVYVRRLLADQPRPDWLGWVILGGVMLSMGAVDAARKKHRRRAREASR